MKTPVLLVLIVAVSTAAFGQGKVNFVNDLTSLIVLTTDSARLLPADVALAGQAVGNQTPLLSGITLMAGLYGGTSSASLFLYSTVLLNDPSTPAGRIPPTHVVLDAQPNGAPAIPGIASGTAITAATPWFQVKVWDAAYANYEAAFAGSAYVFLAPEFQMNPGASLGYQNTAPPGPNSTWVDGPIFQPLGPPPYPEPSSISLLGLGAALVLLRRRSGRSITDGHE